MRLAFTGYSSRRCWDRQLAWDSRSIKRQIAFDDFKQKGAGPGAAPPAVGVGRMSLTRNFTYAP